MKRKSLAGYLGRNWEKLFVFNKKGIVEQRANLILTQEKAYEDDIKVCITIERKRK